MIVFPEIFYRGTSFLNSHHWSPAQKRCGNDRMGDYRVFTSVRFNWLKIVANLEMFLKALFTGMQGIQGIQQKG